MGKNTGYTGRSMPLDFHNLVLERQRLLDLARDTRDFRYVVAAYGGPSPPEKDFSEIKMNRNTGSKYNMRYIVG